MTSVIDVKFRNAFLKTIVRLLKVRGASSKKLGRKGFNNRLGNSRVVI